MDAKLSGTPILNTSNQSTLYSYLRDVSNDSAFAISFLQVLIEERRATHRERWNEGKEVTPFVGDIVKAHI